jgi:hypothetical protein
MDTTIQEIPVEHLSELITRNATVAPLNGHHSSDGSTPHEKRGASTSILNVSRKSALSAGPPSYGCSQNFDRVAPVGGKTRSTNPIKIGIASYGISGAQQKFGGWSFINGLFSLSTDKDLGLIPRLLPWLCEPGQKCQPISET